MTERDPIEIARAALELVARERDQLRPLVKSGRSSDDSFRADSHCKFVAIVDALERCGVTHSDFSRYLNVNRSTISNWFLYGYTARNQIPAYALVAAQRLLDETLGRTGTHG